MVLFVHISTVMTLSSLMNTVAYLLIFLASMSIAVIAALTRVDSTSPIYVFLFICCHCFLPIRQSCLPLQLASFHFPFAVTLSLLTPFHIALFITSIEYFNLVFHRVYLLDVYYSYVVVTSIPRDSF